MHDPCELALEISGESLPISERDASAVLPPNSWTKLYCEHAFVNTTSPLIYQVGMALTILGATCPMTYGLAYPPSALRANLYTMLVGRSGDDQKSTALGIAKDILREADKKLIGRTPVSDAGLLEDLAEIPKQTIFYPELGTFLSMTRQEYAQSLKPLYTELWDNEPVQRRRANNKIVAVNEPRLSLGAAVSLPYLEAYTLAEDWSGGFMGRWLVLWGQRERVEALPTIDNTRRKALVDALIVRATAPSAGWCLGLDSGAKNLWKDWFDRLSKRNFPSVARGVKTRAPGIALRIALVYGWDFGPPFKSDAPWRINPDILEPAIALTDLYIRSVEELSDVIADHEDGRIRRSILECLNEFPSGATLGQVLGRVKRRKRVVVEAIDGLRTEGVIEDVATTNGNWLRRVH